MGLENLEIIEPMSTNDINLLVSRNLDNSGFPIDYRDSLSYLISHMLAPIRAERYSAVMVGEFIIRIQAGNGNVPGISL